MNSKQINSGTVMVDGVERTLSHVAIWISRAESPSGPTLYHELAWFDGRGDVHIIESHLDASAAATLFYLLNTRRVSIDTQIRLSFKQSRAV